MSDNGERQDSRTLKPEPMARVRRPQKKPPGPPDWGLDVLLTTPLHKKNLVTETDNQEIRDLTQQDNSGDFQMVI